MKTLFFCVCHVNDAVTEICGVRFQGEKYAIFPYSTTRASTSTSQEAVTLLLAASPLHLP